MRAAAPPEEPEHRGRYLTSCPPCHIYRVFPEHLLRGQHQLFQKVTSGAIREIILNRPVRDIVGRGAGRPEGLPVSLQLADVPVADPRIEKHFIVAEVLATRLQRKTTSPSPMGIPMLLASIAALP